LTTSHIPSAFKKYGIRLFTRNTVAEDTFVSAESFHKEIPDTNKESKVVGIGEQVISKVHSGNIA